MERKSRELLGFLLKRDRRFNKANKKVHQSKDGSNKVTCLADFQSLAITDRVNQMECRKGQDVAYGEF